VKQYRLGLEKCGQSIVASIIGIEKRKVNSRISRVDYKHVWNGSMIPRSELFRRPVIAIRDQLTGRKKGSCAL